MTESSKESVDELGAGGLPFFHGWNFSYSIHKEGWSASIWAGDSCMHIADISASEKSKADVLCLAQRITECLNEVYRPPHADTALRDALNEVIDAARDYLPPDGISKDDFIHRVLAATDNPTINAALARDTRGSGKGVEG